MHTINSEPWMPDAERSHFHERVARARTYLEFGSGGSTMAAVRAGVDTIISVESDQGFADDVRTAVESTDWNGVLLSVPVDIGETKHHGRPKGKDGVGRWPRYSVDVWDLTRERGLQPDLILIDGRFRVACLFASLLWAPAGTVVLFDDYYDREAYRIAERYAEVRGRIGRMAEFEVDAASDPCELAAGLARYVVQPG